MREPLPLGFGTEWNLSGPWGAPVVESILEAFVGRCQICGADAEEQVEGSILTDLLQIDGTLYGDTFCAECLDVDEVAGPVFCLPPVPADARRGATPELK